MTKVQRFLVYKFFLSKKSSVAEPEPPGAATFRVGPEPRAGAAFFKAAPAASFWQAKKKCLVVVTKHDLK